MSERELLPPGGRARLCLDYGVDEQLCESHFTISDRGMRFIARWHFNIGTQLALSCLYEDPRYGCYRVRFEGIVVWSEPSAQMPQPAFDTTVLFLELPEELKQSLREISYHLEAAG